VTAARLPRLLTIMGSGETSPTMVTTHRRLVERLGPPPVPAVLLDTPFGFQANADELSARAVAYFASSVGLAMDVAGLRSADVGTVATERVVAALRRARYLFAGPGSPTYALRQWRATPVPGVLAEKLERGGAVTFASAAALTLGVVTVPVYEVYKVGAEPHWLEGLDLLAAAGLRAAVVPHYDNAEGRNHDTRFCYLGERRLAALEAELPDGAFVLGVDEHTGLVLDLDSGRAEVVGRGGVTVRVRGRSTAVPSGTTMAVEDIAALGSGAGRGAAPRLRGRRRDRRRGRWRAGSWVRPRPAPGGGGPAAGRVRRRSLPPGRTRRGGARHRARRGVGALGGGVVRLRRGRAGPLHPSVDDHPPRGAGRAGDR
jgi:hypothetical protein